MDTEFITQVLAFQKKAEELTLIRMPKRSTILGFRFELDGVRVEIEYPDYEGGIAILIPWSDLTL